MSLIPLDRPTRHGKYVGEHTLRTQRDMCIVAQPTHWHWCPKPVNKKDQHNKTPRSKRAREQDTHKKRPPRTTTTTTGTTTRPQHKHKAKKGTAWRRGQTHTTRATCPMARSPARWGAPLHRKRLRRQGQKQSKTTKIPKTTKKERTPTTARENNNNRHNGATTHTHAQPRRTTWRRGLTHKATRATCPMAGTTVRGHALRKVSVNINVHYVELHQRTAHEH